MHNDKDLKKILEKLEIEKIQDYSSGKYSNVKKLSTNSNSCILKSNHAKFPILGEIEFLQKSSVSPHIIDYSVTNNWILMDFIEGKTYDRHTPSIPKDYFIRLAKTISQLHIQHNPYFKTYYSNSEGKSYKEYKDLLEDTFLKDFTNKDFLKFINLSTKDISKIFHNSEKFKNSEPTLTHGDLHPSNTIDSPKKIYLIDPSSERYMDYRWDYAMLKWQMRKNENYEEFMEVFRNNYEKELDDNSIEQIVTDLFVALMLEVSNYNEKGEEPWAKDYIESLLKKLN